MNVLVCGASGCVGRAVASALRSRGHRVIEGGRAQGDAHLSMHVDFMQPRAPQAWAAALAGRRVGPHRAGLGARGRRRPAKSGHTLPAQQTARR